VIETIEVPAVDFAECLRRYGVPYYLKIDIEGMDTLCLKALIPFEERPDYISLESDKVSFNKLQEEFNLLIKLGYTKFQTINQASVPRQKEPEDSREGHFSGQAFPLGSSGLFGSDLRGEWEDHKQILKKYKRIFLGYELFGDAGRFVRFCLGRVFLRFLNKYSPEPIPGWYDTHAKHSSVPE